MDRGLKAVSDLSGAQHFFSGGPQIVATLSFEISEIRVAQAVV
jgi:hypothetical protein